MTPRQLQAFDFIREWIDGLGTAPTIKRVAEHLKVGEPTASRCIDELVQVGALERTGGTHRNIRVAGVPDLRLATTSALQSELARRGITLEALDGGERRAFARGAVTCAADCCGNQVRRGQLFCLDHWRRLPVDLQRDIVVAHAKRDLARYQNAVAEARDVAAGYGRWQRS